MDPQAEPDLLEAGKDDCQNTTMTTGSNLSQTGTQPYQANRMGTRYEEDDLNDLTSDMTWLTAAEDSSKWDAPRQPNQQRTTKEQVRPRLTTKTKDHDETILIFSQKIDSETSATPKATTASTLVQKTATRVSHDTLILSETQSLSQHRCKTTLFQAARDRNALFNYFCQRFVS